MGCYRFTESAKQNHRFDVYLGTVQVAVLRMLHTRLHCAALANCRRLEISVASRFLAIAA